MARDLSGDKVRFYLWFDNITDGLADKIRMKTVVVGDIVASAGAFSADGTTDAPVLVAANALWLRGVDVVSTYGTTTNSTTLQPFGEPAFNIRTASTINDITITVWPDYEEELEARVWSDVASNRIAGGTEVLMIQRTLGNEADFSVKHYNLAVGQIGEISHSPQKESAQSYSRVITPTALVFGLEGPSS